MAVTGNGSTTPTVGAHAYACGTIVDISAVADTGWQFVYWSGDVADPGASSTTVTMDGNKTVTANFSEDTYTLTMAVTGNGSTTPAVGDHDYSGGSVVDISAVAANHWYFLDWTGDVADPADPDTTVTMDGNKTVTANFALADIIIDDPDATFVPDCSTPGSCDPYIQWAWDGYHPYGEAVRYMSVKSLTPGGAIDGTASWTPTLPVTGQYNVYAWWDSTSGDEKRSSSVTYTIYYNDGTDFVEVLVDQTENGGQWNFLEKLDFSAGTSCYVEIHNDAPQGTDPTKTWVIADAIRFEPVIDGIIMDDPDATFVPDCTTPGSCDWFSQWAYTTRDDQYGTGLRYMSVKSLTPGGAIDGVATWTPTIPSTGQYSVYAWWDDTSGDERRSSSVTYTIYYNDGYDFVEVPVDQTANGGQWNLLDTLDFSAGTSCYVELSNDAPQGTDPTYTWVIADAIWWKPVP
jgi:hypothetical protein